MTDIDMFSRDPEEVGEEHPDDLNLRMRLQQAMHEYEGDGGKCTAEGYPKFCYEHNEVDYHQPCGLERWSVLHYSDRHDSECYCNECSM